MPRPPTVPRLGAVDDPALPPPQTPWLGLCVADKVPPTDFLQRLVNKLLPLHLSLRPNTLITVGSVAGNFVIVGTSKFTVDSVI